MSSATTAYRTQAFIDGRYADAVSGATAIAGGVDVAVDFTVKVPAGVKFMGHIVNGDGSAKNLDADTELSTVNGQVLGSMSNANWIGMLRLATVNGNVAVKAPAEASIEVSAQTTTGSIESDFPLAMEGNFGSRRATGVIGKGDRSQLRLSTVNGNIRIQHAP